MPQAKRTREGGERATTQTIEQIEARAEAIRQAEADAMTQLAAFLRDLAVDLPAESRLPVKLEKAAEGAELFSRGSSPEFGLTAWIDSLPTTSSWRFSFLKARGPLENRLALLREES